MGDKNILEQEYKKLQEEGSDWSFGSKWGDQMEEAILEYFAYKSIDSLIIDVGCGEGRGLLALQKLGFTNLKGVDISTPKVLRATKEYGLDVYECDFHDLSMFADGQFDYLFCSHAIEHSLVPELVIKEFLRISAAGLVIVPIDPSKQPPLGKSPHTHNFSTVKQWTDLWDSVVCEHVEKKRLGMEVWTYYES